MTPSTLREMIANPRTSDVSRAWATNALRTLSAATLVAGAALAISEPAVSPLEEKFLALWQELDGPELRREFEFSGRKFRFDFVHLASMTAIELEGGGYAAKGRHFTAKGFEQDCVKYNLASIMGYRVFRLTGRLARVEQVRPIVERCVICGKTRPEK